MVNYSSSANLGGGRFAPSVQYNTPIRMPTQPLPRLPDVNSTFNIDLRPVGQAIVSAKEMETKAHLTEKEMEMKYALAEQEKLQQMMIKKAEWDMKERHHQDDITLGYAKLAAKNEKDQLKTIEMNNAVYKYYKGLDVLEKELQDNNLTPVGFETEKRKLFDEVSGMLQYNPIGSFVETVEKARPGSGSIKTSYMMDYDAKVAKGREAQAAQSENIIANVSTNMGVPITEAVQKVEKTQQSLTQAMKYLELADNPPSIISEDKIDSYRKSNLQQADRLLGVVGGAKVMYDFNKNINNIVRGKNVAEGMELLRQSFHQSLEGTGVSAARVENLWNIYRNYYNLDTLLENTSKLSKAVSDNQKLFINRAVDNKVINLISDEYIGDFMTTMSAFPWIKDIFVNDPSKFTQITDLTNAVVNASSTKAEPTDTGWKVSLSDGSSFMLDNEHATSLLKSTGTDNIVSALIGANLRAARAARNSGDFEQANKIASKGLTAIRGQEASSTEEALNRVANTDTALKEMNLNYLGDLDENAVLKQAHYKLLSRYGQDGYAKLMGEIVYLVPDEFWKLKGGKLYVFPKSDGTLGIHREQFGVLGGLGRDFEEGFKGRAMEVARKLSNAGLSVEEQITMFRTALNDDTKMLEIKEKDWQMPVWTRVKTAAQAVLAIPIEAGAQLDTAVAKYMTLLSRAESLEDVKETFNMLGEGILSKIESSLENIRDNQSYSGYVREGADKILNIMHKERTVKSLNEAETAIKEDSKRKIKPVETGAEIKTPVNIGVGAVKKKTIEPVEASVEGIEDDEIIAIVDY